MRKVCIDLYDCVLNLSAHSNRYSQSGAFQISGLMFLVALSITTNKTHAFLGLASVVCSVAIIAGFMLPVGSSFVLVSERGDNNDNNHDATTSSSKEGNDNNVNSEGKIEEEDREEDWEDEQNMNTTTSDISPPTTLRTKIHRILKILIQIEYLALLGWFSLLIVPLQYYIGTIGYQLEDKGDENGYYTNIFSIIYASAAALAPFGGYLSDRLGLGLTQGLATSLSASSFFFLAAGNLQSQLPGMCIYSVGRLFVFGMYFANIGKRFGYTNYGLLAGLGLMVTAIVSLLQYPLITLVTNGYARQVNIICGSVLLIVGLPYCLWLGIREKKDEQE